MQFARSIFGYNSRQVDTYLRTTLQRYEQTLAEQQQRITDLREENAALKQQLEPLKAQQDDIAAILVSANARAERMLQDELRVSQKRRILLEREIAEKQAAFERACVQMEEGIRQAQKLAAAFAQELNCLRHKLKPESRAV